MKKLIFLISFLSMVSTPCYIYGAEVIESFDNKNIPVLNDSLDQIDRDIRELESSGLSRFQTPTNDGVPVGNGTNFITTVLPGCATADTAKLLYNSTSNSFSCGIDSNSPLSNVLFSFSTGTSIYIGSSLVGGAF